jgi:hypothetical protein
MIVSNRPFDLFIATLLACSGVYSLALIAMPAPPRSVDGHIVAYLHDGSPEVHSLGADRAVPELLELANLLRRRLDVVGVLGDALVCATLGEAHVGIDLAGGHLSAERPDTEAGGHVGRLCCCEWRVFDGRRVSL